MSVSCCLCVALCRRETDSALHSHNLPNRKLQLRLSNRVHASYPIFKTNLILLLHLYQGLPSFFFFQVLPSLLFKYSSSCPWYTYQAICRFAATTHTTALCSATKHSPSHTPSAAYRLLNAFPLLSVIWKVVGRYIRDCYTCGAAQ